MTLVNPFMSFPAAGGSSFDPTSITGCDLWLDASDESSITDTSGAVSQWDDLSGNSNHATQSTASAKPTTGIRTVNGLNVLDFDGSDFFTLTTGLAAAGPTPRTFLWVAARDTNNGLCFGVAGNAVPFLGMRSGFTSPYGRATAGIVHSSVDVGTATAVMHGVFGGSNDLEMGWNGANLGSGGIGATGVAYDLIGKYDGGLNLDGFIAEIISYDNVLSSTDFDDAVTYLADKWGITL